jgi:hypothetical protein
MLIELDKSIVLYIKNYEHIEKEIIAIDRLAHDYFLGKNILVSDLSTLEFLSSLEGLSDIAKNVFLSLCSRVYEFKLYKELFLTKVIVHKLEQSINNHEESYYLDLNETVNISEAVLLSENLSDCVFYESLITHLKSSKPEYEGIGIRFHHSACGGSQADIHARNELDSGKFVLQLVDTDKKFCDSKFGESYKKAYNVYLELRGKKVIGIHTPCLRAKENYIPPNEYMKIPICDNKIKKIVKFLDDLTQDESKYDLLRYLDIKNGYKIKHYLELANLSEDFNYFFKYLDHIEALNLKLPISREDSSLDLNAKVMISLKSVFKFYVDNDYIKSIDYKKQPIYILNEWEKLFKRGISWGCCIPEYKIKLIS